MFPFIYGCNYPIKQELNYVFQKTETIQLKQYIVFKFQRNLLSY